MQEFDGATFVSNGEENNEYAVTLNDGTYIGTFLGSDREDAVQRVYDDNQVSEESYVVVTEVETGASQELYVADVVDVPEPWESGAGGRFSNLDHTDPEAVKTTLDGLLDQASDVPGLGKVIEKAKNAAEETSTSGFECPVCGLRHGHSITKHDSREIFGVTDKFAAEAMKYNPVCHCGVHELASIVSEVVDNEYRGYQVFEQGHPDSNKVANIERAAQDAPVPDSVRQDLDLT